MGTAAEPVYITDSYDAQTTRLTEQDTQTGTGQASIDDLHYTYDEVGDVTSEADTPSGASSATDVQCFAYDYLGRLTQAWAQGSTGCAATPSASAEGGAAPYWESYTYNTTGDLTGITATTPSGAVTTTADTYPSAGSARPHAVTTAAVTTSSGTTTTSYSYDADGHLTGVTEPSQSQALTWNDAGQLSQDAVTPSGGSSQDTGCTYDADGNLLLTADPGTTTLYLPDEQLSLNTSTGTVTGTRYYSLNGVTVAARTGASSLAYLTGDQEGTDSVAIDSATLAITRRYYDPYGNTRGTATSGFPAGTKGFIGGTSDTSTGLTDLGAREYQSGTGSFVSPDPLLKPYDPQDLDPYAYAEGNPATYSDPTGDAVCTGGDTYCGPHTPKQYTGAHGCVGQTQSAVNACVQAYDIAHQNSQPRGTSDEPVLENHPSPIVQELASVFASLNFNTALQQLIGYFNATAVGTRWVKMEDFGAILSDLEVDIPGQGLQSRLAVFVSKSGLPKELSDLFTNEGIQIFRAQAWMGKGDAEQVAKFVRDNPEVQRAGLDGGEIRWVNAAVSTNEVCSGPCASDFNDFIDDPDVSIQPGGYGFERAADGRIIQFNPDDMSWYRQEYGGGKGLEVVEKVDAANGVYEGDEDIIEDPGD